MNPLLKKTILLVILTGAACLPLYSQQNEHISASETSGCLPLSVSFSTSHKGADSYTWKFSNGVTSKEETPTILFEKAGTYDVALIVEDDVNGVQEFSITGMIQVAEKPKADFSMATNAFCSNDVISFTNKSLNATSYLWDFGDGTFSNDAHPTHTYTRSGDFIVSLIAYNGHDCSDIKVSASMIKVYQVEEFDFTADNPTACENDATISFAVNKPFSAYRWNFGDSTSSTVAAPIHHYSNPGTRPVSLTVTDSRGCRATLTKEEFITIHQLQELKIDVSDTVVCRGQSIDFLNQTRSTKSIDWHLSNGFTSSEPNFTFSFDTAGYYSLGVTHLDRNGCTQSSTFPNLIQVVNTEKARIDISSTEGCAPLTVTFNNTTSDAIAYSWEIGNKTYSDKSFSLTFEEAGVISLTSITTHAGGCISTKRLDSAVVVHLSNVTAQASVTSGCAPLTTSFSLSRDDFADLTWHFGDGHTSNEASPVKVFDTPGRFNVYATFTNEYGCFDTIRTDGAIHVFANTITFDTPDTIRICAFEEVAFTGKMGKDTWTWNFGDGNSSPDKNPIHQFTRPGIYHVQLQTLNAHGCPVTINDYNIIKVNGVENSDFNYSVSICPDKFVSFEGVTDGDVSYHWNFGDGSIEKGQTPDHDYTDDGYYQVTLTTTDAYGCKMIKAKTILVDFEATCIKDMIAKGVLDSSALILDSIIYKYDPVPQIEACSAPFEITFQNPREKASAWLWQFGDGNTSEEVHPTHIYEDPGEYFVTLISHLKDGTVDTASSLIQVIINDQKVDFTFKTTNSCHEFLVAFQDISENAVEWSWAFGNDNISSLQHPEETYVEDGIYQVNLVSTNDKGCSKRTIHNVSIGDPNYFFSYDSELCGGDTLSVTHNIDGYKSYIWSFGDGTNYTGKFPKHVYDTSGTFQLQLRAIGQDDCERIFNPARNIVVNSPVADFEINGNTTGCGTLEVAFTNLSKKASRWFWDFGNGVTSTEKDPTVTFSSGTFSVSLTAFFGNCSSSITRESIVTVEEMQAVFSFTQDQICFPVTVQFSDESPEAVEWQWNLGDGTISTEKDPVHTYFEVPAKKISLTVKNNNGCKSTISNDGPIFYESNFEADVVNGCIPLDVAFSDLSEGATSWHWDFGDGSTSTIQHPLHTYQKTGVYTVSLVTTSLTGCADTIIMENYISAGLIEEGFSVKLPPSLCSPLIAEFKNETSGATTYEWDFGDGASSSLKEPVHVYSQVGTFNVQLIASDSLGCIDTIRHNDLVTTLGPEADYILSDSILCHPQAFQIQDKSATAVKWEWYFGDGNISSDQNPIHQYKEPGAYSIALIATDQHGCEELKTFDSVRVYKTPEAKFSVDRLEFCNPAAIKITNETENRQAATFSWNLGQNYMYTEENPVMEGVEPGSYQLSLTATNMSACSNTFTLEEIIWVRDTFHLKEPNVFQLTVLPRDEIDIQLSAYQKNNLKYHLVYKKSAIENGFHLVDTIKNGMTTSYYDSDVDTREVDYSYKFQSHVYCQSPVPIEHLKTYKSINLKTRATESGIVLNWTPYLGHTFKEYALLRKMSGAEWEEVTTVPSNQRTFTDTEDLCPTDYEYTVIARNLDGLNFHSISNNATATPVKNVFADQKVDIVRTTVVNDQAILTEWKDPEIGFDKVLYYQIWRSTDRENFEEEGQAFPGENSYYDTNVDVQNLSYTYKISVINTCDVAGKISNTGNSILLEKSTDQYINQLRWNRYEGWEEGVGFYLLQKKNENGEWETVEQLPPDKTNITIDLSTEEK